MLRTEYTITRDDKPEIWLFCRDNGAQTITKIQDFVPYFYCLDSEIKNAKEENLIVDPDYFEALDGTPIRKVYTKKPSDVPLVRDCFEKTFEADVPFGTRYQIDCVDTIEPTVPRVQILDIETDSSGSNPIPDIASVPQPIICISCHDSLYDCYVTWTWGENIKPEIRTAIFDGRLHSIYFCRNEKDMLKQYVEYVRDNTPDILSGWWSSGFDLPYVINRCGRLGVKYELLSPMQSVYIRDDNSVVIKGVSTVDILTAYRHLTENEEESYRLDFIARKLIGEGKTESGGQHVSDIWREDIDRLIRYNLQDVYLTRKIEDCTKHLSFLDEIRRMCFCQLEDTLSVSKTTDTYILRYFHGKKIFPTKTHHQAKEYEGALVQNFGSGLYSNVICFDVRSLYPSLISIFNLSPETLSAAPVKDGFLIDGVYFDKSKHGFLPEVIDTLFAERDKYKKLMKKHKIDSDEYKMYDNQQKAVKRLSNSLYGQCSYAGSRLFCQDVGKTITFLGRSVLKWSIDFVTNLGYKVIYSDTDSLYFSYGDIKPDFQIIENMRVMLNRSYKDFIKGFEVNQ